MLFRFIVYTCSVAVVWRVSEIEIVGGDEQETAFVTQKHPSQQRLILALTQAKQRHIMLRGGD